MKKDLLLVIDMQNVYGPGGMWHCPGVTEAGEKIRKLIDRKQQDLDIIFTKFLASEEPIGIWVQYNLENAEVNQDDHANELMEEFQRDAETFPVYVKSVYSSLDIPQVRDAAKNANRVLVCGVVAECCVLATAMSLIDAGSYVIYLRDAVAGIDASTEAAVELVLAGLEPLHVRRMTVEEYLNC